MYVHTVVETPEYLAAAKRAGMTDAERDWVVDYLAKNPSTGAIIEGTGGARKVRVPKEGGGKSGGYRVVTFYANRKTPVFLITVISKGNQANLTKDQKQSVKDSVKADNRRRRK